MSFFAARLVVFSMIVSSCFTLASDCTRNPTSLVRLDHTVRVVVRRLGDGGGLLSLGVPQRALLRPQLVTSPVHLLEDFRRNGAAAAADCSVVRICSI